MNRNRHHQMYFLCGFLSGVFIILLGLIVGYCLEKTDTIDIVYRVTCILS
jgi:hypothetical protein